MCGIAGICSAESSHILKRMIAEMNAVLIHRGPDGVGEYINEGVALGHRRLSIIDLSDLAAQPMVSANNRFVMTYNGEVYNFKEIRSKLEARGCKFRSQSDSEVVLEAYASWGKSAFAMFNGMFSVAIWDTHKKTLVLARDRFGIKPLYYCSSGNKMIFASEIKAILPVSGHTPVLSRQGLIEYLHYGITHGARTLYENIHKLEAGHFLEWQHHSNNRKNYESHPKPFWSFEHIEKHYPHRAEAVAVIKQKLESAVERHLIADVPVGLFLSGGLDSTTICALAAKSTNRRLQTWSVEFEGQTANSELALARQVAQKFDTDHQELTLNFLNLKDVIEQMADAHDQPFGDAANVPLYLMTRALGDGTKVVLQGDGGDELFGGYSRYNLLKYRHFWQLLRPLTSLTERLPANSRNFQRIHRMVTALSTRCDAECQARLLTEEVSDHSVSRLLRPSIAQELSLSDPFRRYKELASSVSGQSAAQAMLWTDTQILLPDQFLEKVDRSTMANSVEVRVPMLDTELTDYVMGLPASMKLHGGAKSLLREASGNLLPKAVTQGKKRGFGVPYVEWLSGPLANYTKERILGENGLLRELFLDAELELLVEDNIQMRGFRGFMLYKLLMLAVWSDRNNVRFT
ncbi:asparagine synthase (glutamine-hydrolyzing) [bacterium]|nr:asparagine synthase (glutamine-hydrolyzing) [bacterium]